MRNITKFLFILLLVLIVNKAIAQDQTLKLVYKDVGKPPYMEEAPDSSGLYKDMLEMASSKIGFKLEVIRVPKVRTYKMLEHGDADLYASGEFRDYRAEILHYFPNGLFRNEVYYGLTAIDVPDIKQISDIKNHGLVWIVELGSSWPLKALKAKIPYSELKDHRLDIAVRMINDGRHVFFHCIKEDFEKYLQDKGGLSAAELGLKVHENCIAPKAVPLYLGFSRKSKYYQEQENHSYDKSKALSAENYPFMPVPGSVADKLRIAFEEMIETGEIDKLLKKYELSDLSIRTGTYEN